MPPSPALATAMQAHQAGRLGEAEAAYRRVLALDPGEPEAHHLLGVLLGQRGDADGAARHLREAVELDARHAGYRVNLAEAERRRGRLGAAAEHLQAALKLAPGMPQALFGLGNVRKAQGDLAAAARHYEAVLKVQPGHVGARYNLGNTYLAGGRYRSALEAYQEVVRLQPAHAPAHNNLGAALKEWDRLDEAARAYRTALELDPALTDAWRNLGQVLEKQADAEGAARAYAEVVRRHPQDRAFALMAATRAPMIPASNAAIDAYRAHLDETLKAFEADPPVLDPATLHQSGGEPPALLPYQGRDDRPLKERWARLFRRGLDAGGANRDPAPPGTELPHVGFVVTRGHEGVFLKGMRGLIRHLPRDRFRVTVVCGQPVGPQILGPELPGVPLLALSPRIDEAAAQLRAARFDALHWWEIGTDTMNYTLPLLRTAPVQMTSWGWPVTSGMEEVDRFLSTETLEPPGAEAHYTETLVRLKRLPTYYFRPPVPEAPRPRAHVGLPPSGALYLCPQNLRKVHPDMDPLVAGILRADPAGTVAFVHDKQPGVTALLKRRFEAAFPDVAGRVRFLARMPEADYLGLVARADVLLDTPHYGGGANTTYDAFAAGTPVVTLPTAFHRGRYATAAYAQLGVEGGVAASPEDYVTRAVALGTEAAERDALSRALREALPEVIEDGRAVVELADALDEAIAVARGA